MPSDEEKSRGQPGIPSPIAQANPAPSGENGTAGAGRETVEKLLMRVIATQLRELELALEAWRREKRR